MWDCGQVKEEAAWDGVSAAAARAGLYNEHEVKPEVLQPPDFAFTLQANIEVTVVKQELNDEESGGTEGNGASSKHSEVWSEEPQTTEICREQIVLRPCTINLERILVNEEQQSDNATKIQQKTLSPNLKGTETHNYNCEEIDNIYLSKKERVTPGAIFTCDTCGFLFNLRKKIIRHLRTCSKQARGLARGRHNKITEPLSCKTCNKQFKARLQLTIHERSHTGEKPFKCEICQKHFITSSHLYRHKRTHAPQPHTVKLHSCETCNKKYKTKYDLFTHMRIHTGQMPYTCQVCGKQFNKMSIVKNHEKLHAGNKPYCCEICSKQFAVKWNLTKHLRGHTKETPYSCNVCNKKFMHSYSLTKHRRTHSGERSEAALTHVLAV